jgi:hypothetical protein
MSHLWSDDSKDTVKLKCRTFEGCDFLELSTAWNLCALEEDEFSPYPIQCYLDILLSRNAAYCRGSRHLIFEVVVSDLRNYLHKLAAHDLLYGSLWRGLATVADDYGFVKICRDLIPHMYK